MNFFLDNMMSPVLARTLSAFADGEHAVIPIRDDPRFRADTADEAWITAPGDDANGPGQLPGPGDARTSTDPSPDDQAVVHSLWTATWSLLRWMWSWTLATHESGIRWCRPSGLSFLVNLIWLPWTWSTRPTLVPHEA